MNADAARVVERDLALPGGITLRCRAAGAGPRRIVLLHGFPEAAFVWDAAMLARASYSGELVSCCSRTLPSKSTCARNRLNSPPRDESNAIHAPSRLSNATRGSQLPPVDCVTRISLDHECVLGSSQRA